MKENEAIKFLLDSGLLFEINRSVLHPLGLALAVRMDEDGNCEFDGLWDSREDPEGIIFDDEVLEEGTSKYMKYLDKEGHDKLIKRYDLLGYVRQEKHDKEIVLKKAQEFKEKLFGETAEKQEEK
jgi:hypothetical protein